MESSSDFSSNEMTSDAEDKSSVEEDETSCKPEDVPSHRNADGSAAAEENCQMPYFDSDRSDCDEFSDISENSDMFHVEVDGQKTWTTPEDMDMQLVDELKEKLRAYPLLPANPVNAEESYMDVHSGCRLPTIHCAITGCSFTQNFKIVGHWHEERVLYRHLRKVHAEKEMK